MTKETWTDIATSIEMVVGKTNDEDEGIAVHAIA